MGFYNNSVVNNHEQYCITGNTGCFVHFQGNGTKFAKKYRNPLKIFLPAPKVTARFEAVVRQSIVAHEKYFFG